MKFRIGAKMVMLVTALVCITAFSLVWLLQRGSSEIVIDHDEAHLGDETRLRAWELLSQIYAVYSDARNIAYDEGVQELLASPSLDKDAQAAAAKSCQKYTRTNYLRVELWVSEGQQSPARIYPAEAEPLAFSQKMLQELMKVQPMEGIVSEIHRMTHSQRPVNVVWAGMKRIRNTAPSREVFVLAAMDLDTTLMPDKDDVSPLTKMSTSPRHLFVLINEPNSLQPEAIRNALVYPDSTVRQYLKADVLVAPFKELYARRDELNEQAQETYQDIEEPTKQDPYGRVIPWPVMEKKKLESPLWFVQSEPITDRELRKAAKERLDELIQNKEHRRLGWRIDGLRDDAPNIGLLTNDPQELERLSNEIAEHLVQPHGDFPGVSVEWQRIVKCENSVIHFVLFPVRSADILPGGRRYYGLALAAFPEEMKADVDNELAGLLLPAVGLVGIVALVGFVASLLFTRPLKRITATSRSVAERMTDADTHSIAWRREIDEIVSQLPVGRRDEIGDMARGIYHMIEELRARNKDIREREARLRMIVSSAAEGILTTDDQGKIVQFNAAAERMFGYSVRELAGEPVERLVLPEYQAALRDGVESLSEEEASVWHVSLEAEGIRKEGASFPIDLSITSVRLDDGTRIYALIIRDVTERKRAEQRIRQMNEELTKLNEELDQRVKKRTAELEEANTELALANTELKAARDKAQELSHAKDAFLASVSHELRNPLNQVTGYCQLLEMTDLDAGQQDDLEKIRQAANRLLALINDILDYQKIVMGGITLEMEEFPVNKLVEDVQHATKFQAQENENDLQVHCSDDVGTLYADRHRVVQVLINLVGNACKFTQRGSVSMTAERHRANGNQWIEFSVRDTGRGIKPDEQAKLFTPFTKLSAKQGNTSGTGLGLVISKGFCEMMGGGITFESEYGEGTTFTVRLPAGQDDQIPEDLLAPSVVPESADGAIERAKARAATPRRTGRVVERPRDAADKLEHVLDSKSQNRNVLVIDDDPNVRDMMQRYLSNRGFQVITAADGLEGLDLAKRKKPAAITLDAAMPGLDGWAVLAALKTDADTQRIPVIMVTITDEEEKGMSMGAAEFLAKPIDWERLTSVLGKYTGNKRDRSILVVDDDEITRRLLRRSLESDGWTVLEAEHGAAALECLAIEHPAAIILDLIMPVMDGFEFIAQYSQLAQWLSIPVIVLSAKDPTPEDLERLDGLVVRVLRKGDYSQDEILEEIHRRVDKHLRTETSVSEGSAG